jgi:hypothetical protein
MRRKREGRRKSEKVKRENFAQVLFYGHANDREQKG